MFLASTAKRISKNEPICISYRLFDIKVTKEQKHRSYCKYILGNQPVNETPRDMEHDKDMWRYQYAKQYGWIFLFPHFAFTKGITFKKPSEVNQCFKKIDDIYCHYYYRRCYIDSKPQPICREACEELEFTYCSRVFKEALLMNKKTNKKILTFHWVIINCTAVPFRNETTNCYYPDHDKGG